MNHTHILSLACPVALTKSAAHLWGKHSLSAIRPEHSACKIEMSETTQMDSHGLATLLTLSDEFRRRDGFVRLLNPTRQIVHLLELTRIHRAVEVAYEESQKAATEKPRPILVVEDEAHIRSVAELSIKPLGRAVYAAENGLEAINIARRENPAVIILDYIMPVMDGVATLRRLKSDDCTKHIPVIIMSANEKIVHDFSGQFDGASLFLTKPFSPAGLREEVTRLLQKDLSLAA